MDRDGREVPWPPDPAEPQSFDTLLATRLGALDVVPEVAGAYAELAPRAVMVDGVLVAAIPDLLPTLTRPEHAGRAEALRALRR